jgi:hypothetical protein
VLFFLTARGAADGFLIANILYNRLESENTASCREKNKKNLKEIEDAQLAAHRLVHQYKQPKVLQVNDDTLPYTMKLFFKFITLFVFF